MRNIEKFKPTSEWIKASHSNPNGNCVEVATDGKNIGVRDTKDKLGAVLEVPKGQFDVFVASAAERSFKPV